MLASTSDIDTEKECNICFKESGKYVCPRCNIMYCSVTCYQSVAHSDCSEEFYRKCVTEELGATAADTKNPESMMNILQRLHETGDQQQVLEDEEDVDSDDNDDDDEDLADRMAGVNLDDADSVWDKLSSQEKEEFQRILACGDPTSIIPIWEPWWLHKIEHKLVVDLDETVDLNFMQDCPDIKEDIPALPDATKASPAVRYGVENAIIAYSVMVRHYAGDHHDVEMRHEAAAMLLRLSSSLGQGENFLDHETAVAAVSLIAMQECGVTEESMLKAKQDLECIMQGPGPDFPTFYVHSALSDCAQLLSEYNNTGSAKKGSFSVRFPHADTSSMKLTKKQLVCATKKLEFYIAWVLAIMS